MSEFSIHYINIFKFLGARMERIYIVIQLAHMCGTYIISISVLRVTADVVYVAHVSSFIHCSRDFSCRHVELEA